MYQALARMWRLELYHCCCQGLGPIWKIDCQFFTMFIILKPYGSPVALCVFIGERICLTNTYNKMSIAALSTKAPTGKQPTYLLPSEWIKKIMIYPYNGVLVSNIKEGTICTCNKWRNLKIMLRERRQRKKEYTMYDCIQIKL